MDFIGVRSLQREVTRVLKELPGKGQVVVTRNGRPMAILAAVDESNWLDVLSALRQARAIRAVANLQHQSLLRNLSSTTMNEILAEISEVRRKRRR